MLRRIVEITGEGKRLSLDRGFCRPALMVRSARFRSTTLKR